MVHRDIKPDNVMLAGRHAMVADFGIAKALTVPITGSPKTRPGVPVGTLYYMAPEQVAGDPEVDGRADQYALGVVAYELLTGRRGRIAVGVSDGGSVRLATVTVDGGELAVFRESHLPAMGDLAWSPGSRILYQVAGNRNFRAMNPANGAERALVSDPEVGWLFAAVSSPDGERVAAYWNRRALGGVWVLSVRDTGRALLQAGRADPIGWSADGRSVLTLGWDSSEVVWVGLDGRTEALGTLPFRDPSCVSAEAMAPGAVVCSVPERVSDVWMVEGFDPEVR